MVDIIGENERETPQMVPLFGILQGSFLGAVGVGFGGNTVRQGDLGR